MTRFTGQSCRARVQANEHRTHHFSLMTECFDVKLSSCSLCSSYLTGNVTLQMQTPNPCNLFRRTNGWSFLHFTYLFGKENRLSRASLTHNGKHCPIENSLLPQRMRLSANFPGHCQNPLSPFSSSSSSLHQSLSNTSGLIRLYTPVNHQCIPLFTASCTNSTFYSPTYCTMPATPVTTGTATTPPETNMQGLREQIFGKHACDCTSTSAASLITDFTPQQMP